MTFDRNELAEYETAVETIGNLIASLSEELAEERGKIRPNTAHIQYLRNWQSHLNQVRGKLDIKKHDAVKEATRAYGQALRNRTKGITLPLELPIWVSRSHSGTIKEE